jgi:1,4-dihydroxy-2-naphthoate octaprenyltransferase
MEPIDTTRESHQTGRIASTRPAVWSADGVGEAVREIVARATPRARELSRAALARALGKPREPDEHPGETVFGAREFLSRPKVDAYKRLCKLDIKDYYFGLPLVWSLLPRRERRRVRNLLTLATYFASEICVVAATVAFDDVTGYRDGSDAFNYGPDAPTRRLRRKPLLTGELTVEEALRFGWAALAASVGVTALAVAVAPYRPRWAIVTTAISGAAFIQYSWGAKFSYHRLSEVVLAGVAFGWLLGPYGLVAGSSGGLMLTEAVVFGLGPMLFGIYSNTNDIVGDSRVGRRTTATTLSWHGNVRFIKAASLVETLVILGAAALGAAPWWFPLVMSPVICMRAAQIVTGLYKGKILPARNLGIMTHRLAVVIMFTANTVRRPTLQAAS